MSVIAKMSIRSVIPFGVGRALDLACVAANDMMAGFAEGKDQEDRLFSKASPSGDMRLHQPSNFCLGRATSDLGDAPDTFYVVVLFGDEANGRPCKGAYAVAEARCVSTTDFGGTSVMVEFRSAYNKTDRTVGVDGLHWKMTVDNPGAQVQFKPGTDCLIAFFPANKFTRDTAIAAAHAPAEEPEAA